MTTSRNVARLPMGERGLKIDTGTTRSRLSLDDYDCGEGMRDMDYISQEGEAFQLCSPGKEAHNPPPLDLVFRR